MNKQEILEGNKLIAEFMGFKWVKNNPKMIAYIGIEGGWSVPTDSTLYEVGGGNQELYFHSNWNWLMPVVEKVRDSNCMVSIRFNKQLNTTNTMIACFENKWHKDINTSGVGIESTYKAIVVFIKWYNAAQLNPDSSGILSDKKDKADGGK